jgi:hypothetical protein
MDTADSHVALARDLYEDRELIARRIGEIIFETVPSYRGLGLEDILQTTSRNQEIIYSGLAANEAPMQPEDRQVIRAGGAARAVQGISLEDLMHAWRIGLDVLRRRAHEHAAERGYSATALLGFLELAILWMNAGMEATVSGHHDAELQAMRQHAEQRVNFLRRILTGGLSTPELHRSIEAYAIDPGGDYFVLRARPSSSQETVDMERQLQAGSGGQRDSFAAVLDGDLCGFASRVPKGWMGSPIGLSPAVSLENLDRGFRLATRALEVALSLDAVGCCEFDELGVLPAVLADSEVTASLSQKYIAPLHVLGANAGAVLDTVECFIRRGLRYEPTAAELFVHVNTVRYRVGRFEELTGASLRNGDDIIGAGWALRSRNLQMQRPF